MKTSVFALALLLALPMMDEVYAADRGGGSSRDGGGRAASSARDASPSRGSSERQAPSAGREAPSSRGMSTPDRSPGPASRGAVRPDTRRADAVQQGGIGAGPAFPTQAPVQRLESSRDRKFEQPGGISSGTAFPKRDATPRASITEQREAPQQPGGIGAGPAFPTQAPVQRLDSSRDRKSEVRPHADAHRSDGSRTQQSHIRIDRRGSNLAEDDSSARQQSGRAMDRGRSFDHRAGDRHDAHTVGDRRVRHSHTGWHGDIRHFKRHDIHTWRRGTWHHGHHHGRIGWWWVVGPSWYFYTGPVYPYPNPYVPPVVVVHETTTVEDTDYWYYCEDADDYYPYVEECPSDWIPVPAEPDEGMPPRY